MPEHNYSYTEALGLHAIHRQWQTHATLGYRRNWGWEIVLNETGKAAARSIAECLATVHSWQVSETKEEHGETDSMRKARYARERSGV